MFSIGERVMHPGQGLCTVVGFEDSPSPMLILETGSGRGAARLMYPAAQAEKNLHPPVSRDEALAAIDGYGDLTCDPFSDRNSGLEEKHFKQRLKLGIPESLRVTKTMLERIAAAEACSKKPSSTSPASCATPASAPSRSSPAPSTRRPRRSRACSRSVVTPSRSRRNYLLAKMKRRTRFENECGAILLPLVIIGPLLRSFLHRA